MTLKQKLFKEYEEMYREYEAISREYPSADFGRSVAIAHRKSELDTAMTESVTIPIQQWQILTSESKALKEDLIQCRTDLTRIKKPSAELLKELEEAEKRLKSLQEELTKQKEDLILLSSEVNELKTLSEKLKKQIDKERRVYKRQVWQNRFWCILIGAGIGFVAGR